MAEAAGGKIVRTTRRVKGAAAGERQVSIRCLSSYERQARERGFHRIAGLDEVGRGCLFGPVFAAAVILDPLRPIRGLCDSKIIEAQEREKLARQIKARAVCWAVAGADVFEIDQINIYQASRIAMRRSSALPRPEAAPSAFARWRGALAALSNRSFIQVSARRKIHLTKAGRPLVAAPRSADAGRQFAETSGCGTRQLFRC